MPLDHPHIEIPRFVYPGPYALQEMQKQHSARYFNLSSLPTLKVCAWCNARPFGPRKRRYCSDDCRDSASLYCHPQQPAMKMFILITLQDCACVGCGEMFDDKLKQLADEWFKVIQERQRNHIWKEVKKVPLYLLGDGTGHLWEVDHIIPIFRGGAGVGIENIQVLCVNCHKKKTIRERGEA